MIFREIAFGSDEFQEECRLRNEVLRRPLGLDVHDEDLEREREQFHFGLFAESGEIAACVIAAPVSSSEARIRQMAVASKHQGKGHGRQMIQCLEEELARRGFVHLFLNARLSAVPFYKKMGYTGIGEQFLEVGIPHLKMEKISDRKTSPARQEPAGDPQWVSAFPLPRSSRLVMRQQHRRDDLLRVEPLCMGRPCRSRRRLC